MLYRIQLVTAVLLALCSSSVSAQPKHQAPAAPKPWVTQSNSNAQILIKATAQFIPEMYSQFGIPGYDDQVLDLQPDRERRLRSALANAKTELQQKLKLERDANVRQDLEILIDRAERNTVESETEERLLLPFIDAAQLVFSGVNALLQQQTAPERRSKVLQRLQRYVGLVAGTTPTATLARQRYEERTTNAALLRPSKLEVEQALRNGDTYIEGIRKAFETYKIAGGDAALAAMEKQLTEYNAWLRASVLPTARAETILPIELYTLKLKDVGIDLEPQQLLRQAQLEFMETRSAMQQIAPRVAKERGLTVTDYREVIKALKRETIPNDKLEQEYRSVLDQIDPIIRKERLVDLPNRPMVMRLATPAENAAQQAPHFRPPQMIGNTGQQGQFVLTQSAPGTTGGADTYDDFNYSAVRWTLSAHEARPGHELQFSAMVERGLPLARSLFAFNSVNIEGWGLYAEAELLPYEPLDAQLIALQFRLLRAARAMLDPMINLGLIDRDRAGQVLTREVVLSPAMAKQELDRYGFNMPGQAGSYYYGYSRLLQLRAEAELALGSKFDRLKFNNFVLDQGMLPPDLMAKAVHERLLPPKQSGGDAQKPKPKPPASVPRSTL
jgi:hypothetical protein